MTTRPDIEKARDRLRDHENEGITGSDRFHLREEVATLLDALLAQEPIAEITDIQGSLNDISIVTWRKHQPLPPVGTLLYAMPVAGEVLLAQEPERESVARELDNMAASDWASRYDHVNTLRDAARLLRGAPVAGEGKP